MNEFLLYFVPLYIWHMLGITIGYHRLLAHRSFRCPKPVEYFWILGGYLAFESSPIWWATVHRAHHRYTDTDLDPHSPRAGIYQSHLGWIFDKHYPDYYCPEVNAKDLISDPIYRFLEQGGDWHKAHLTNSAIGFGSRLLIWAVFGWKIALASLMAGLIAQQVPFLLNVICHIKPLGYKNYKSEDDSVNVWWVALITAGEGWHNNHHAYPGSARSGFKLHEVDLAFFTIKLMSFLKLASHVNERFSLEAPEAAYEGAAVSSPLVLSHAGPANAALFQQES